MTCFLARHTVRFAFEFRENAQRHHRVQVEARASLISTGPRLADPERTGDAPLVAVKASDLLRWRFDPPGDRFTPLRLFEKEQKLLLDPSFDC